MEGPTMSAILNRCLTTSMCDVTVRLAISVDGQLEDVRNDTRFPQADSCG